MKTYKGKKVHFAKVEYEQEYKDADTTLLFEYQGYCDDIDNLPHGTGKMTEIGDVRKGKKFLHEAPLHSREGEWINGDFYKGTYFMPPGRKNKGTFAYSVFYKVGDSELDGEGEELYYENEEDSENNKLLGYAKGTFRNGTLIKGEIENASLINYSAMKGIKKIIYKGYVGCSKNIHGEKTEIQKGEIYYEDGFIYKGEIDFDLPHGKGVGVDEEGNSWSGNWFNGNLEDKTSSEKHPKQTTKIAKGEATNNFLSIKSKNQKMPKYKIREKVKTEESIPTINNNYILTKTKIISGQQCQKKLWFDFHEPVINDSSRARLGIRFEEVVKKKYRKDLKILDLSNKDENSLAEAIKKTQQAINTQNVDLIYEGHFLKFDTFVRTDILKRNEKGWDLYEIKATGEIRDKKGNFEGKYIKDIAIQSYIAESCGINLTSINVVYINKEFEYLKNQDYQDLDKFENITDEVRKEKENIIKDIKDFKLLAEKNFPSPKVSMGSHCNNPKCNYLSKCKSLLPDDTYTILPNLSPKQKGKFESENILHLKDVSIADLSDRQALIKEVHVSGKIHFDKKKFKETFAKFTFPYYFMDFEFVGQVVPLIKNTRPLVPLLFQWSVHKWNSLDEEIRLEDGHFFLEFNEPDMEKNFIESLLKAVGKAGTIFCHHKSAEITQLNNIKKYNYANLTDQIDSLIDRIEDTETLVKDCFYSPKMNGKFGLKEIIKAIPKSNTNISYGKDDGLEGGTGAELAWAICTDPNTPNEEIENQKKLLKEYCAKDTFAMHDIVKYLIQKYDQELK